MPVRGNSMQKGIQQRKSTLVGLEEMVNGWKVPRESQNMEGARCSRVLAQEANLIE